MAAKGGPRVAVQDAVTSADYESLLVLDSLPLVTSFDQLRAVSGEFFLECFAGHAAFTLAVVMARVPALRPWELEHGHHFDVVSGLPLLLEGIRLGVMFLFI